MPITRPGVVFVHYRLPDWRLRRHFESNEQFYRQAAVYVVAETEPGFRWPRQARPVVFPEDNLPLVEGVRRFSLARTRNAGLRQAVLDHCDPIICTDTDILFTVTAWQSFLTVDAQAAVIPLYRMSYTDQPERVEQTRYEEAPAATGTVAMRVAGWRQFPYEERCFGYGGEDGLLLRDLQRADYRIIRQDHVWHLAHKPDSGQREWFSGGDRADHHQPDFNPFNMFCSKGVGAGKGSVCLDDLKLAYDTLP